MRNTVAAVAIAIGACATPALSDGDAAAGEKVFKKCAACHAVGDSARNKSGPMLNGIVGATVGSVDGFRYSKALEEKRDEGMVWDAANLSAYLEKPRDFIPGGKMAFAGLRKEEDRLNVIAYLETHGAN